MVASSLKKVFPLLIPEKYLNVAANSVMEMHFMWRIESALLILTFLGKWGE